MAPVEDLGIAALVYDYLLKKDAALAKVFQKKTKAVRLKNNIISNNLYGCYYANKSVACRYPPYHVDIPNNIRFNVTYGIDFVL